MVIDFQTTKNKAGYTIEAAITVIGTDILCTVIGGDHPHIGTVTKTAANMENITYRFPSHDGRFHKDDALAEVILARIKSFLPRNCVIVAGIHVDYISKEQITAAIEMGNEIGQDIADWLQENNFKRNEPHYY